LLLELFEKSISMLYLIVDLHFLIDSVETHHEQLLDDKWSIDSLRLECSLFRKNKLINEV